MKITGQEKKIEQKLKKIIDDAGGMCIKFPASFLNGFPDRICLLPGGKIFFVELKSKGKTPEPLQLAIHRQIRKLGFKVFVIDSEEQLLTLLDENA